MQPKIAICVRCGERRWDGTSAIWRIGSVQAVASQILKTWWSRVIAVLTLGFPMPSARGFVSPGFRTAGPDRPGNRKSGRR